MKNIIFTFILIALMGCSDSDNSDLRSQLNGKWKWIESSGGIDGRTETPESSGNSVTIEFTRTTVKTFINGNLKSEVNYEIQSGSSIRTTKKNRFDSV